MAKKNTKIEQAVSDALTEQPLSVEIDGTQYEIKPPTLGKMQILSKLYLQLGINEESLTKEPLKEAMRICANSTDAVANIMAVATFDKKEDLLNSAKINERADLFKWSCKTEDFATVILAILTLNDYGNFLASIRLTKTLRQNKPSTNVPSSAGRVEQ